MSTQYATEPPPTATVLLHTTAGPLTISLFAKQAPLTCRNFLQHCLDGYYDNNIFHRVAAGFVIQTGDPTGTGEGGQNIYEDREFERLDADWAKLLRTDEGESIKFGDEIHSRLRFNRRGLIGMAKGTGDGAGYGSQFFITLGDCRAELDGNCTMFGRVEGEGIYNVVKIADGELIEGTERPMYPEKIQRVEVIEMPKGDAWDRVRKRDRVAARTTESKEPPKKNPNKKKGGKALLSFGGDDGEEEGAAPAVLRKAKFNTALIDGSRVDDNAPKESTKNGPKQKVDSRSSPPAKRKAESTAVRSPSPKRRKPSFHDSTMQLPLRDPEEPSRSPTPEPREKRARRRSSAHEKEKPMDVAAEIAALKASMRRDTTITVQPAKKQSALESLIPTTSIKGRRRPRAGEANAKEEQKSMSVLDAFKARMEGAMNKRPASAESESKKTTPAVTNGTKHKMSKADADDDNDNDDEEAKLCDLHFIANCQSCFADSHDPDGKHHNSDDDLDTSKLLAHSLTFEKDRLGKDLNWKKKNEDDLVVIDPREREKDLGISKKARGDRSQGGAGRHEHHNRRHNDRDRERSRRDNRK